MCDCAKKHGGKLVSAWDGSSDGTANYIAYANRIGLAWGENLIEQTIPPF